MDRLVLRILFLVRPPLSLPRYFLTSSSADYFPVIRKHISTGLTTFFGNVTSAYGRSKHHGATEPPYLGDDGSYHPLPTYGDGTTIENKYLDLALSLAESSQVLVNWQEGDIVLLDVCCPHSLQDSMIAC